jgi:GH18 family chitinase
MRRLNFHSFDGIVLECNMFWLIDSIYPNFEIFLKNLYENLKKTDKMLILSVFPYSEVFVNILTKARFEEASKYVDYFNIMTYDYYTYQSEE